MNRTLMSAAQVDYLAGLADGRKCASNCNTWDDAIWAQRVVADNLWGSRPKYVCGFVDGFAQPPFSAA